MVDPGTVFLFKAASTMIVAAVQLVGTKTWPPRHLWDEVWGLEMSERTGVVAVVSDVGCGDFGEFLGPFEPPDIPRNWKKY